MAGCSRAPSPRIQRLAILPFENLTGDPALDWVQLAAPTIVAAGLTGLPHESAVRVETPSDAYRGSATRLVHGYFSGGQSALHFRIEVEDAVRHKITRDFPADGGVLAAMNQAARQIDPGARGFSTSNPEAVDAWGQGQYERAVALDPDFGAAWLDWTQSLASRGQAAQAIETASRAIARPGLRSPVERAQIAVVADSLRQDPEALRRAFATLATLVPADAQVVRALGQADFRARRFAEAAQDDRRLLAIEPENVEALNSLGYAEAYAGNLDAARKALEEYGAQPGQKVNSLDSLGEVSFLHGRFADAEGYFFQAYQRDAAFLGGGELLKAAYASRLGGNHNGGDALMKQYLDYRASRHDPLVLWREAEWDFAAGRREQAIDKLRNPPAAMKDLAARQIAVWTGKVKPPADLAALEKIYRATEPSVDGQARTFYAAALVAAGRKDQARPLLALWPLPEVGGNSTLDSLVYPAFVELRQAMER